ncbi:MAG: sodium:proton antiporter [Anaerolineae bacterium]
MNIFFAVATGVLFGLGVFQLLRRDLVKAGMGLYTLFTAVNLFMLAAGAFDGQVPPYTDQLANGQPSDPVVQGLLLTAIVISLGSYCLILGMIEVAANRFNTVDSHEIDQLKG